MLTDKPVYRIIQVVGDEESELYSEADAMKYEKAKAEVVKFNYNEFMMASGSAGGTYWTYNCSDVHSAGSGYSCGVYSAVNRDNVVEQSCAPFSYFTCVGVTPAMFGL